MTNYKKGDKVEVKIGKMVVMPAIILDVKLGHVAKRNRRVGEIVQTVVMCEIEWLFTDMAGRAHRGTTTVPTSQLRPRYSVCPELDYAPTEESEKSE